MTSDNATPSTAEPRWNLALVALARVSLREGCCPCGDLIANHFPVSFLCRRVDCPCRGLNHEVDDLLSAIEDGACAPLAAQLAEAQAQVAAREDEVAGLVALASEEGCEVYSDTDCLATEFPDPCLYCRVRRLADPDRAAAASRYTEQAKQRGAEKERERLRPLLAISPDHIRRAEEYESGAVRPEDTGDVAAADRSLLIQTLQRAFSETYRPIR